MSSWCDGGASHRWIYSTTIRLFFLLGGCFRGRGAANYIKSEKRRRRSVEVKVQQLLCHRPQRNTRLLTMTSMYNHEWVDSAVHGSVLTPVLPVIWASLQEYKKNWRTSGAVCVCVRESVQYMSVGLCLCAFASGAACSVWATLKTVWAQIF